MQLTSFHEKGASYKFLVTCAVLVFLMELPSGLEPLTSSLPWMDCGYTHGFWNLFQGLQT